MRPITVVQAGIDGGSGLAGLARVAASGLVERAVLVLPPGIEPPAWEVADVPLTVRATAEPGSGAEVAALVGSLATPYLLQLRPDPDLDPVPHAIQRLHEAASAGGAPIVYGDAVDVVGERRVAHPLADHQPGSVGDRFDLGPLALWSRDAIAAAMAGPGRPAADLRWHAWYALRLAATAGATALRLPDALASRGVADSRSSGQAVFDYLRTARDAQREAERVLTAHLGRTGARVEGPFRPFAPAAGFDAVASVVIPVRDRIRTVADAVRSALAQRAGFPFNVIVVDNHSTDGTTERLAELAAADGRLVHHVPARRDLGIGGCWNEAVFHPACGAYAVQLDSDDLYASEHTLARMVEALRDGRCGMAIGSYTLVDVELNEVPPGLIDHREWTDDNGPNNALRVDGLGAPRAFATELVRAHPFPNVSYGEDYAVALRLCREYRVGRIFDSLYLCRRWEDNTDAALSPAVMAGHQTFKDRLRTLEIAARQRRGAGADGAGEGGA